MTTFKKGTAIILCLSLFAFISQGCKNWSKTAKGGTIGAGGGGLAGADIGKAAGNTVTGAIIGAAVGGAAGAAIGNYMHRQAREMEKEVANAEAERLGSGIKSTSDSGILFPFATHSLRSTTNTNIERRSTALEGYPDSKVMFAGHTESKGARDYNPNLSETRPKSVARYASEHGVDSQ